MDKKTLPPLPALRAFEAAARHTSFARAGTELHLTAAAISHQIKLLEQWLGVALFARRPNGVALTAAGNEYAKQLREVFERLLLTSRALRDHQSRPVVRIRCQFSVATLWLTPRVLAMSRQRPDLEIRVIAAEHRATGPLGADIAIYYPRSDLPQHSQQVLLRGPFRAFASPSLLGRACDLRPAQLAGMPLLHLTAEDKGWTSPGFSEWFEAAGVQVPSPLPGLRFNLAHLAAQAAIQGAGIALLPEDLCLDSVHQGQLVVLPGPALPAPLPFMLMCKDDPVEAVASVRDALLHFAATEALQPSPTT